MTCCVEHSGVRQTYVLFLKLSCTDELCSRASRRSAMCLQRSSKCQLLPVNDNRSGSVYIWPNTAVATMATAPAHCWELGIFFPPFFCVDASREWHVVKNKPTGEKLEETFLRSLIWGSSLKGNSLKAHSYIPPVPPAHKYMNE